MTELTTGYVTAALEGGQWVQRGNVAADYRTAEQSTRLLVCSGARYNRHRFQTMAVRDGRLFAV